VGLPADYWQGESDNNVVLVDNVRDSNFYDFANNQTYIGGFFTSFFNELTDRNVMTIDAFDWVHRTGANPSRPARPYLYEGTFAHEYQHLLEYYEDPDEGTWINEGLSMYAEALTGYSDPSIPITRTGFEGGLQCFLGWGSHQTAANPNPRPGGPENSLTYWGDQGDGDELLCDYGAAESFMHMLADRYGAGVLSRLHRADQNGLASVRTVLKGTTSARNRREILHDWAATVALDSLVDHEWQLSGGPRSRYRTASLDLDVDWDNEDAYSTPGAPPNGSDYVRLRGGGGNYVSAAQIRSITFDGARFHRPDPIEWVVDNDPPLQPSDPAFYSGSGINFDRAIVYEVAVPKQNPTLTFDTLYETEPLFDYGFVQVSTDGGKTYQSLANDITTDDVDPTAFELVVNNLPGLNGNSGGGDTPEWVTTSFDLSAYAGRTILLSFRYITDSSIDGAGWWIDDVRVGGQVISNGASFAGWKTPTGVRLIPVKGFTVQLVAYSTEKPHRAVVHRLELKGGFRGRLGGAALRSVLDGDYDVVAAIVTYNEPTELLNKYAPYRLWIAADAVQQPGGVRRVLQRGG
jgi:hypothetical protein